MNAGRMGFLAALAALLWAAGPARAEDVSGAGATFPYPIYAKWAAAYKAKTGIGVRYEAIGSSRGIERMRPCV